jgi:hypothetical protein
MGDTEIKCIQKADAKLDMIITGLRFFGSLGLWIFVGMVVLFTWWNFEPDPLTITKTENAQEWVSCDENRTFRFERDIKTTKYIEVFVDQSLVDLETGVAFGLPAIPPYSGAAGDRRITYVKEVPVAFAGGREYEYRPVLTYKVNPISKRPTAPILVAPS